MAKNQSKITKKINLDLSNVPASQRATVKREVGDFVVDEILRSVSGGRSPVSGRGKFKTLNKEYAKNEKGGNRNPNLELDGDMLDSLVSKNVNSGVEVGIFKSSELGKADGHNNFDGDSKLPTRRFIPDDNEKFKKGIETGIKRIVKEFEVDDNKIEKQTMDLFGDIKTTRQADEGITIGVDDILSDDFLESFLASEGYI